MSNQSPCTDPLYPCTALTLAEKSAALDGLTRLRTAPKPAPAH